MSFIEEKDLEYRKITLEEILLPISVPSGQSHSSASLSKPRRKRRTKPVIISDSDESGDEVSYETGHLKSYDFTLATL